MPLTAPAPVGLLLALLSTPAALPPVAVDGPADATPTRAAPVAPRSSGAVPAVDPVGTWPLAAPGGPEVVAGFDPPADPWGAGHRGVDLLGRPGQPVRAALAGRVSFAGRLAGRGVLVVDHGPTRTTYEPVTATVPVGAEVTAGTPVGRLELVGSHCFPRACLHWGWLEGETYLDPLRLVGLGPVRLLPLWGAAPTPRAPAPAYARWRPLGQQHGAR